MKQPPNPVLLSHVTLRRAVIAQAIWRQGKEDKGAYQWENSYESTK